jgi:hypothetical protein
MVSAVGKKWDSQVVSVAAINGVKLVLKADGSIYQHAADGSDSLFDNVNVRSKELGIQQNKILKRIIKDLT